MIIENMPFEEYKEIDAINNSTLSLVSKSLGLIEWSKNCPSDDKEDDAGIFGNAFHCLVLEPDEFASRYIVAPKCDRRKTEGKKIYQDFLDTRGNKIVLEQKTMKQLDLMRGSVMAHPEAKKMIEAAKKEVTFVCEHEGHRTKSRHDLFIPGAMVSADLKTLDPGTREFHEAWGAAVEKRRYDVQEAHYRADVEHETWECLRGFFFIVVSKRQTLGRYETHVMRLTNEQRERGAKTRERDIEKYLKGIASGRMPGIEVTVTPAYALREE